MIDLFISYATKDSQIAYRLFGDIIKSGGKAYLYEKQDTLVNFEEEIRAHIKLARGFCFIDSQAARKAKYVKYECELALQQEHITKNEMFFVLLTESNKGGWRDNSILFKAINLIKYIDLSLLEYGSLDNKRYDFHDRYYNGVSSICERLDLSFAMPHPGIKDFDKELNLLNLKGEIVDQLKSDFKSILSSFKNKDENFNKRVELIIDGCKKLNIKTICPYLVVGSYHLHKKEFDLAKITYLKTISKFKQDPRGWIGLSYSTLGLNEIKESLYSIKEAENIILKNKNNPNLFCHYSSLIHNKIKLLIACEEYKKARIILNSLDKQLQNIYEFKILDLLIHINMGEFLNKQNLYNKLISYYTNNIISSNETLLIADIEHKIGRYYSYQWDFLKSIHHYQNAINYCPQSIQFHAELAQVYYTLKEYKYELKCIAKKFCDFKTNNSHELYYLGLIKYLNKERRTAKKLFKSASDLNYQYYSKLIPKKSFISSILRR
ncbi:TIR domain-containing protein [Psychroserpens sp.]